MPLCGKEEAMSFNSQKEIIFEYDSKLVFGACKGHYEEITRLFLGDRLDRALACPGHHVPDPYRPGSKDGMRVAPDFSESGKVFFNTNPFGEDKVCYSVVQLILKEVPARDFFHKAGQFLGLPVNPGYRGYRPTEQQRREAQQLKAKLAAEAERRAAALRKQQAEAAAANTARNEQMWASSVPLFAEDGRPSKAASSVWSYFHHRGLGDLVGATPAFLSSLRFVPRLPYRKTAEDGCVSYAHYDALVSRVEDGQGRMVCLHRTYLDGAGSKAPEPEAKRLTPVGQPAGGDSVRAIKIAQPYRGVLGIAEGIETALSIFVKTHLPCWAVVSATMLKEFVPPEDVHSVIVFADKDASGVGRDAAEVLKDRLVSIGVQCFIVEPRSEIPEGEKGVDWNDVLRAGGEFPRPQRIIPFIEDKLKKFQEVNPAARERAERISRA